MQKIIAILVLASHFDAAVETDSGFERQRFPNTGNGVEAFSNFAAPVVRKTKSKYRFCVSSVSGEGYGEIGHELMSNNHRPAFLNQPVFDAYANKHGLPKDSAVTLANACLDAFPFIRKVAF